MVELIVGKKGKGKTKVLLDKVNGAVKEANGSIVYLDKSTKHMYELNNKVRLIDVSGFPIKNADEFVGFICGILSQFYTQGCGKASYSCQRYDRRMAGNYRGCYGDEYD